MNAVDCIKTRRSIRSFKDTEVSAEDIKSIVELAAFAPSWKNSQTVRYIAVADKALKDKIAEECTMGFEHNKGIIKNAPVLIAELTNNKRSGYERDGSFSTSKGTHWQSFDAGIAAEVFCLAAHEKGLSTVIMGIFEQDEVVRVLDIPETQSVSALIALGYADEQPEAPKRKSVEDLLKLI